MIMIKEHVARIEPNWTKEYPYLVATPAVKEASAGGDTEVVGILGVNPDPTLGTVIQKELEQDAMELHRLLRFMRCNQILQIR